MLIVVISGQSGSGKSEISIRLRDKLNAQDPDSAQIVNMDDYYHERPLDADPQQYRNETNFDQPKMVNLSLLLEHLVQLSHKISFKKPIFDFVQNLRHKEMQEIHPSKIIIIEGIFAQFFHKEYLCKYPLNCLLVNVATESYWDILKRRIGRDEKSRGRSKEEVIKAEHKFVGDGFFRYTASKAPGADIYICNQEKKIEEEQKYVMDNACEAIIGEINNRVHVNSPPTIPPQVQKIVAQSHLFAGTLHNNQFEKKFNGAFGEYAEHEAFKEFSHEETNRAVLITDLREYLDGIKKWGHACTYKFYATTTPNYPVNFYLAKTLLDDLLNYTDNSIYDVFSDLATQREALLKKMNLPSDSSDSDDELNSIIEKARTFASYDPAPTSTLSNRN